MNICPKCGLPEQACVCADIAKEEQKIRIGTVKRKFGKITTVVEGFDSGIDIKEIAKKLKNELACGGTVKNNSIELQGDHTKKIRPALVKYGFRDEQITE
ncbi:stress response translation initiation inhibitor YciH [Candidatus Pacearchaeota archaeon]|nr:stress response translation initiation inhibitor YciH [Candidatus Pacearchaeota archaeon]